MVPLRKTSLKGGDMTRLKDIKEFTRDNIINDVVIVEGGYVNHPNDPGGPTNYGITQAVARKHGHEGDMRQLPKEKAVEIYIKDYWNKCKCDELMKYHPFIAYHMFDYAVNAGPAKAMMDLQRVLNVLNDQGKLYPNMIEDGAIGPTTLRHLEKFLSIRGQKGVVVLTNALITLQGYHYINLMAMNEKREAFGMGWLTRASDKFNIFNDMQ